MCIIIDTNTLAPVFNQNCSEHGDFKPVFDWIYSGRGRIIYGGTKYKDELKKANRFLGIFLELKKQGRAIEFDKGIIDTRQIELEREVNKRGFDDAHIIAISIVSGCGLICSNDKRANPFFHDKSLYPKKFRLPKIYSGSSNRSLISARILKKICKLCRDK